MTHSEDFDRAIESLLEDRSPRADAARLDAEEQRMLRMAQLLRGSRGQESSPEFVERLHNSLFAPRARVSRRAAFLSGLGALAAGVLAGIGLDRSTRGSASVSTEPAWIDPPNGTWFHVANLADLPDGAVRAFKAGAVQGFLVNRGGRVHAVSRMCTHMGCSLNFSTREQAFVCPCHGAEFDLRGRLRYGPHGTRYRQQLPPLPVVDVRVRDQAVEVWSV